MKRQVFTTGMLRVITLRKQSVQNLSRHPETFVAQSWSVGLRLEPRGAWRGGCECHVHGHCVLYVCVPVPHYEHSVLDFSLTHPRTGASSLHPVGSCKPDALANLTQSRNRKHAIMYEQANDAFLSLTADAHGKLSDDFVRFLWMLVDSASTNSRHSRPSAQDSADPSPDSVAAQVGSSFSCMRARMGSLSRKPGSCSGTLRTRQFGR
jgi:hypothetical protein